jgi:hypothetical protein
MTSPCPAKNIRSTGTQDGHPETRWKACVTLTYNKRDISHKLKLLHYGVLIYGSFDVGEHFLNTKDSERISNGHSANVT